MGIINITDDSFYSGSRAVNIPDIVAKASDMINEGADILDIGGVSTRPGAKDVPLKVEAERILPAIEAIKELHPESIISIDTFRSEIAERAIYSGADIINDISAGDIDPQLPHVARQFRCPYIAMHMQGRPATMQQNPHYEDVTAEILDYFIQKLGYFKSIDLIDVIFDPGFGFGKTIRHNYTLLNNLEAFQMLDKPILVGMSRKGMLWKTLNSSPDKVLPATNAVNLVALQKGAKIIRVHDVEAAVQLTRIFRIMKENSVHN